MKSLISFIVVLCFIACTAHAATLQFNETQWVQCNNPSCSIFNSELWIPAQVPTTGDSLVISNDGRITVVIDQVIYLSSVFVSGFVTLHINTHTNETTIIDTLVAEGSSYVEIFNQSHVSSISVNFTGLAALSILESSHYRSTPQTFFGPNTTVSVTDSQYDVTQLSTFGTVGVFNGTFMCWTCSFEWFFAREHSVAIFTVSVTILEHLNSDDTSAIFVVNDLIALPNSDLRLRGAFSADSVQLMESTFTEFEGAVDLGNLDLYLGATLYISNSPGTIIGTMEVAEGIATIYASTVALGSDDAVPTYYTGTLSIEAGTTLYLESVDFVNASRLSDDETTTIVVSNLRVSAQPAIQLIGKVNITGSLHVSPNTVLLLAGQPEITNYGLVTIDGLLSIENQFTQVGSRGHTRVRGGYFTAANILFLEGIADFNYASILDANVDSYITFRLIDNATISVIGDLHLHQGDLWIAELLDRKTPSVTVTNDFAVGDSGRLTFSFDGFDLSQSIQPIPVLHAAGNITGDFNKTTLAPFGIKVEDSTIYLTYAPESPPPPASGPSKIAIIVGCVVGGVVFIAIVIGIVIWRRRVARSENAEYKPFLSSKK